MGVGVGAFLASSSPPLHSTGTRRSLQGDEMERSADSVVLSQARQKGPSPSLCSKRDGVMIGILPDKIRVKCLGSYGISISVHIQSHILVLT